MSSAGNRKPNLTNLRELRFKLMVTDPELLRGFFALEDVTRFHHGRRIDRDVPFIDMPNDAFFIDQEGGPIAKALLLIKDAIIFYDGAFEIAQQRERNCELFGKFTVGGNAVNTQSKNLSLIRFELGDISLIRLQFLRSTTGECEYINREYDVFLAFEIAELVSLSVGGAQREIRRWVTDLQVCFRWRRLLGQHGKADHSKQPEGHQCFSVHQGLLANQACCELRLECMHKAATRQDDLPPGAS